MSTGRLAAAAADENQGQKDGAALTDVHGA